MALLSVRTTISATASVSTTIFLFFVMRHLVNMTDVVMDKPAPIVSIEMDRVIKDSEVRAKRFAKPVKEELLVTPPTVDIEPIESASPGAIAVSIAQVTQPEVDTRLGNKTIKFAVGPSNTDLVPRVRIEPMYPRRAKAQRIEGWVTLKFDVTKTGATTNIRIIDARPKKIFDRAAIQAISKWKYAPRVVDGEPTLTKNQKVRLEFNLKT